MTVETRAELDRDVECAGCGYNLRGLREDGLCPECGIAVAASADRTADWSRWGRWVGRGALAAMPESLILMLLVPLSRLGYIRFSMVGVYLVMGVSAGLGAWWIGRPEPERSLRRWPRVVVRVIGVVGAASYVLLAFMERMQMYGGRYMTILVTFLAISTVRAGLEGWLVTRAGGRLGLRGISRAGTWVMWIGPLIWVPMLSIHVTGYAGWAEVTQLIVTPLASAVVLWFFGWFYLRSRRLAGR